MIKVVSLGCKVNSYEASAIKEQLFSLYPNKDIVLINTCSVTSVADQKSRQIIRRERKKSPEAILVVMGCYSQNNAEYVLKECGADIVVGTSNRAKIGSLINSYLVNKEKIIEINPDTRHFSYESFESFAVPDAARAYIKIEDGCNNFCSYCTIPYTRGVSRSRPKLEIIEEIKSLISKGYLEFVLTGIHTAHYGIDNKECKFSDLVEELLNLPGLYRLRISSIEESEIDEKLISLFTKYPNLAHHLHMPLQSGSSTVLKRMRRKYRTEDFINKVNKLRDVCPDIAITTDVIVGFPQESEEEFQETVNFIKKVNFAEVHVFPFSARPGTDAAKMDGQIDPRIKQERVQVLLNLSKKLENKFKNRFFGQEMEVILEERNKQTGLMSGFTSNYIKLDGDFSDEYKGKVVKLKVR